MGAPLEVGELEVGVGQCVCLRLSDAQDTEQWLVLLGEVKLGKRACLGNCVRVMEPWALWCALGHAGAAWVLCRRRA